MFRMGKWVATESRLAITRNWVGSDWKDENGAQFFLEDENVLELDYGDACTVL